MNLIEAVNKAQQGMQEGISWLYEETYQKSYYVSLKYMKQEDAAHDVLQDAYIKAFKNITELKEPEKFPSWLARIVACTALDELKKRKPLLFSQMEQEEDSIPFEFTIEEERVEFQPEFAYEQKEISSMVEAIIKTLSDEQRMCIMMYYLEQMSIKEIAEILNCSANTVKSRLNYGRNNIKKEVEELEKKGIKLYGVSPLLFFLLLLQTEEKNLQGAHPVISLPNQTSTIMEPEMAGNTARKVSNTQKIAAKIGKMSTTGKVMLCLGAVSILGLGIMGILERPTKDIPVEPIAMESSTPLPFASPAVSAEPEETLAPTPVAAASTEKPSIEQEVLQAYTDLLSSPEYDEYGFQIVTLEGLPYPALILSVNAFDENMDEFDKLLTENDGEQAMVSASTAVICGYDSEKKQMEIYIAQEEEGDDFDLDEENAFINTGTFLYGGSLYYDEQSKMIVYNAESAGGTVWLEGFACPSSDHRLQHVMEYVSGPCGEYEFTYQAKEFQVDYYNKLLNKSGTKKCNASNNAVISEEGEIPELEEVKGDKLMCYRNTEENRNKILK